MLTDTSYLIINVGIMVVISALFIILFYRQHSNLQEIQKSYIKHLEDSEARKTEVHNDGMEIRVQAATKVNTLLRNLAENNGAYRSYIMELHNSANNFTGLPFAKFSMTYEHFSYGHRPIIHQYQNMSASTLAQTIFSLYQNKYLMMTESDSQLNDYQTLAWFMINNQVKTILLLPLRDAAGKIFGIVGFDFNDDIDRSDWTYDVIQDKFQADVARIAGYLDFSR